MVRGKRKRKPNKGFKRSRKEWEESLATHIGKFFDRIEPESGVRLAVWLLGTVACHNLNIGGMINWFGKANDRVDTGLPYPFKWRRRFPWEKQPEPTTEDKITEWAIPAITSWMLVYHPDAIAKFVDAMIPL